MRRHRWAGFVGALHLVVVFTAHGAPPVFLTKWGIHGTGAGQFRNPQAIAVGVGDVVSVVVAWGRCD